MRRPRIALIGGHGGPSGVPRHIEHLCSFLADSADITVLSDKNEGGYDFVRDLEVRHVTVPGLTTTINPTQLRRSWKSFQTAMESEAPFDILWAHSRLSLPFARRYVRSSKAPPRLIVTLHGSPFSGRSAAQVKLARLVEGRALSKSPPHEIVFLSQSDLMTFAGLPLDRHKVHVITNSSNLGGLPPVRPPAHPTLVMTTRSGRQKNLQAAAQLFAALPDNYRLILCGMGTDSSVKSSFMSSLGPDVCSRITFGGPVLDVRPDLVSADAYLLTSHYEGFSIGSLEAFEAGLPVVMPQIGGACEMLKHHPQCLIIDPSKPLEMAPALHQLVVEFRSNRDHHIALNRAAWAKSFHLTRLATQVEAMLALDQYRD